jgi:hypothetical protein
MGWSVAGSFSWGSASPTFAGGAPFDDDGTLGGPAPNSGSFTVWSVDAAGLTLEGTIHGDASGDLLGWSMSGVGDIDLDLSDDLAVGAPGADFIQGDVGMVRTYTSGSAHWTKTGLTSGDQMGAAISLVGDLDGDSASEVLVGEPGNGDNGPLAGRVRVFSGLTSVVLDVRRGDSAGDQFGSSLAQAVLSSNWWIAGAPQSGTGPGYVRLFNGPLGVEWFTLSGDATGDEFGSSIATGAPFLMAVGARTFDGPGGSETGMARLHHLTCPGIESYCTAGVSASGCQVTLEAQGYPTWGVGNGFTITAKYVEGAKNGVFFFGWNGRQAAPWGNSTSYQCVKPPVKRVDAGPKKGTPGSCSGYFYRDFNALWFNAGPKQPPLGAVVQLQLWYRDPQNTSNQTTSLSNAVEFAFCH